MAIFNSYVKLSEGNLQRMGSPYLEGVANNQTFGISGVDL